jgi:peptidoglycan/xylan/chitin deacetylase (PgdA/CDA1 family)
MATAPKSVPKNPPPLKPGMDHALYDYSPFPKRPKLNWPRNARVAFCVVLHLEYFELMPAENSYKDPRLVNEFGNYVPDFRTWTQREYGNRAGIFRVLDVLDRYQIRAGVAVNAMAAERYPFLVEQFKKRKYEFIAHGISANRMITSKMSEAEEKQEIEASIAAIEKATGTRPKGWQGQDYGESQRTPQLLADRRPALSDEGRQEIRLDAQPAGMGRRAATVDPQDQHDALPRPGGRRIRAAAPRGRAGVQPVGPSLADGHGPSHQIPRRGAAPHRAPRQCLARHAGRDRGPLHADDDGVALGHLGVSVREASEAQCGK